MYWQFTFVYMINGSILHENYIIWHDFCHNVNHCPNSLELFDKNKIQYNTKHNTT